MNTKKNPVQKPVNRTRIPAGFSISLKNSEYLNELRKQIREQTGFRVSKTDFVDELVFLLKTNKSTYKRITRIVIDRERKQFEAMKNKFGTSYAKRRQEGKY